MRSVDCQNCSYCFFGCAYGCKQSTDRSLPAPRWKRCGRRERRPGRGDRLDSGRASGVIARTAEGALEVKRAGGGPRLRRDRDSADAHRPPPGQLRGGASPRASSGRQRARLVRRRTKTEYRTAMVSRYSDSFIRDGFVIELFGANPAFAAPSVPGLAPHTSDWRSICIARAVARPSSATTAPSGRVRRGRRGEEGHRVRARGAGTRARPARSQDVVGDQRSRPGRVRSASSR